MTYRQVKQLLDLMSDSQLDSPFLVFDADEEITHDAQITIANDGHLRDGFQNRQPMIFFSKTSRFFSYSKPAWQEWLDSVKKQGGFGEVGTK